MKRNANPTRDISCFTRSGASCGVTAGRVFGWRSGSFLLIAILLAGIGQQSGPLFAQAPAV
ncbi:MAG: hypothetical protein VB857_01305, partial [Pirellulaceae bacterium]